MPAAGRRPLARGWKYQVPGGAGLRGRFDDPPARLFVDDRRPGAVGGCTVGAERGLRGSGVGDSRTASYGGIPLGDTGGRLPFERLLARGERASREAPIADLVDVDGAVREVRRGQGRRDIALGERAQRAGSEDVEPRFDGSACARGEGGRTQRRGAGVELRIGEGREQAILEPDVEIDLVRDLRAAGGVLGAVDREDGDLLVRDGEGIPARVDRLDQREVVAPLPGRALPGLVALRRRLHFLGVRHMTLQPGPQLPGVGGAIDGYARELVGAGRDLGELAGHDALELGDGAADLGRVVRFAGLVRLLGHRLQSTVDVRGLVAEVVAGNRAGRAIDALEQPPRIRIDLLEVLAHVEVAAKEELVAVVPAPFGERAVGSLESVPFGPGLGGIERVGLAACGGAARSGRVRAGRRIGDHIVGRGRRRFVAAENGVDVGLVHPAERVQRVGSVQVGTRPGGVGQGRHVVVAHLRCASVKLRIRKRLHETIVEREVDVELVLVRRAGRDDGEVIGIQPEVASSAAVCAVY